MYRTWRTPPTSTTSRRIDVITHLFAIIHILNLNVPHPLVTLPRAYADFQDEKFCNFLKYLEYWRRPAYAKHLVFPQCLTFLDALNNVPGFRENLAHQNFRDYVHTQQGLAWALGEWPRLEEGEKENSASEFVSVKEEEGMDTSGIGV